MYKKLETIKTELDHYREKGVERGASVGWTWDQFPYTVKLGATTYIGAAPASGKTEFWFEILINLSCLHGWNHVVFSPETGDVKEIFAELCHKYIGKPFIKGEYSMTEAERSKAEYFINEHFIVVDPGADDLTVKDFYEMIDKIERDLQITIHTTTIDPWNELTEEFDCHIPSASLPALFKTKLGTVPKYPYITKPDPFKFNCFFFLSLKE